MAKRRYNKKKYEGPLPVTLSSTVYGPLPEVYPHNPLSWAYFAYKYLVLLTKPVPQGCIDNIVVNCEHTDAGAVFTVNDLSEMTRLWDHGCYGKGIFSRSDPTWYSRTTRRLHLNHSSSEPAELSNEDITRFRREERSRFKAERTREQQLKTKRRHTPLSTEEKQELQEVESVLLAFRRSNRLKVQKEQSQPILWGDMRDEDQLNVDKETMELVNIEALQLQPVELFFLKYGLDVVDVISSQDASALSTREVFFACCGTRTPIPSTSFIVQYVVYHYYRSLGWSVRSGIKFGCDFILYKRGPQFSHAEHAVLVIPADGQHEKSWVELQTLSRVIGSVRKTLVLNYVEMPSVADFTAVLHPDQSDETLFTTLLRLYRVNEVVYRRWVPNKTRD
ncbi:tRNA splicing endonuclease subunit sen2 [Yamadazyma tenuis]|uniref:tRNA-splicing endonuclease subunit Sen2 n=1 Tax=Candida tenuis (strain ATCC 10573 / BCRC 21748 / CBS 615 / JCM 9827 / NBRC 10315 / NRRL Y-1498 / VKM Y-70) TaxID=590646 RepID=G3AXN4_CANTC|nr:uncharacterized protein CANTEDRAFT_118126 [Yamadazyma tenuis ATCC 10573]XP_006684234.1 uncharacterized protein CANTEDRAFT_118126 [Yamadazyma tenuis ATCC 10573]EGV65659.1 hypothetical protein CANTEDRAFT_118126 [Yamadazyma tenuis ATCC 10573]EGV65660.1 hypothetical protein CANTEDRAFT_118126 [Yamadazyma tenuis ATCC 10573]WEJ96032.1 tRNA splicing endonuclease subunit sen2 [Yamadazyma tenuis]